MKRLGVLVLILALSATTTFAQDSQNSTRQFPAANSVAPQTPVDRNAVLNRLVKEVEQKQELLNAYKDRVTALDKQIKDMEATDQKLTESYRLALIEIGELREKVRSTERALIDKNEEIRVLKEAMAKKDGEIKTLQKQLLIERLINAGLTLLKFLR
ncbi:MAG: hypothetical protein V7638_3851 [Acidobacteriota bacterium]|jgi:chromosome segregation ATPase